MTYFAFEDNSQYVTCTVESVIVRPKGSKTKFIYKCIDPTGKRFVSFGDDKLKAGDLIELAVAPK